MGFAGGKRRVDGDGTGDEDGERGGGGVECIAVEQIGVKSSLRFTFCTVSGSSLTATVLSASCFFPLGVMVGVSSWPAVYNSLATCKGFRFLRGEGLEGSCRKARVEGLLLRRVTFLLMERVISSASEIGVLGRECRFLPPGDTVRSLTESWLGDLIFEFANFGEVPLSGDLNLGF